MASASLDDVEGEILRRIHGLAGGAIPVGGVLELHANFSAAMAPYSGSLLAYRENPHTDAQETARRAARILERALRAGERWSTVHLPAGLLLAPTATAEEPLRSLERAVRELENRQPDLLAGYAFADTPDTGLGFSAITRGDPGKALRHLQDLVEEANHMKELANRTDLDLRHAMEELGRWREGPVLIIEPADNIGGGAPGDGTAVLRSFLEFRIENAAAILNDPESVERLAILSPGARRTLRLDGKGSRFDPGPLELEVEPVSRSGGRFELEDPQSHLASMGGRQVDMGPCAVVRHGGSPFSSPAGRPRPSSSGRGAARGSSPSGFSPSASRRQWRTAAPTIPSPR